MAVATARILGMTEPPAPASSPPAAMDGPRSQNFQLVVPPEMLEAMTAGGAIAPRISRAEALQVPAVLRGRNLICGTLSTLPLNVHAPDRRIVAGNTYLLGENIDPDIANPVTLAYTLEDLLFEGIAWWRVTKFGFHDYPVHASYIPQSFVTVVPSGGALPSQTLINPDHRFPIDGTVYIDGTPITDEREVIRFDSPNPPLLLHAAGAIRAAARLGTTANMYAEQPLPLGYFTDQEGTDPLSDAPGSANDGTTRSEIAKVLDDWNLARKSRAWGYMAGLKAERLQWSAADLQLHEARQHAVLEIARAMGLDPEDVGVSTTSRTYQNGEQRRLDLTDFTLAAYVAAVQERLSMHDVLPRGYVARMKFDGFLRSDAKTRMETNEIAKRIGAITGPEIREGEDRPALTPAEEAAIRERAAPPQPPARVAQEASAE